MPEPLRSPKQSRVAAKSRSHPYTRPTNGTRARDVDVERSNSLFGTLKTIVTAPLAWFSTSDSQISGEIHQKRRVSATEPSGTPPKAKRVRRESPQVVEEVGYLDPPSSIFEPKGAPIRPRNVINGIPPARTMSFDPLPSSFEPADVPLPPSRAASLVSRMSMSVEPQEHSSLRQSMTRDLSMPPPSPFARSYSRSSVAPFAPGASFGPSLTRRTRESTAPPLLGSSTPSPSFTRPPTTSTAAGSGQQTMFPRVVSRGWSEGPISSLLERKSVSPMRESPTRSMLVGDEVPLPHTPGVAKAERTLSTLEAFRTPLHSPELSSPPLVKNDRPRKVHVPFPSKLRFDHTPEGKRDRAKRVPDVIGPYSGMSGMRKLLARRREELEKEAETEYEAKSKEPSKRDHGVTDADADDLETRNDNVMETDTDDVPETRQGLDQVNGSSSKRDAASPSSSPKRSKADTYSGLRASSSKVHRSHASAPKLKKTRNKFSLDDEEEEQEWSMSVDELKEYQARRQSHMSFSTRRMSETGMQTDTSADDASRSRIASPPLPAQPQTFDSLLSRIAPSTGTGTAFKPVTEFPAEPPKTESEAKAQLELASSSESTAPVKLPFSLGVSSVPSAPKPADAISSPFAAPTSVSGTLPLSTTPTPAAGEGPIPSFFANTKVQFTPPKVPSGSLFGPPPSKDESEKATEQPPGLFGAVPTPNKEEKTEQQTSKDSKPSPFGGVSKPSVFGSSATSAFGNPPLPSGQATGSVDTAKSTFSLGASGVNGADATTPGISIFGAASKQASDSSTTASDASAKPAFSFNALPSTSTPTPSADKTAESPSTALSTDASSKPVFSFGAPASSSTETSKSPFVFGASSQPKASDKDVTKSPFSFGAAPSTPPPAEKKAGFTFGVTSGMSAFSSGSGATTKDAASAPTPEAPKPIFGGFGSVGTSAPPSTPKPPESTADNGDGMEVAADRMEESPTRNVEKKDTPAMQLPQSSPFSGFGGGTGSSTTPFSFGSDKSASTASAFSLGQSKPANGFTFGQNTNTSTTGASTSTGFSFGTSTKPASQPSSAFGAPLASAFGNTTANATPAASFSFAQPSTSTNANPFGQTQQQQENGTTTTTTTTPSSPSLFTQPIAQSQTPSPSFSFSVPNAPSPFGAAKPDAAAPPTTATQPFQFGTASSSQQQPQQQGDAPAASTPTMFTLGSAATTPRKVKGLPTRRGKRP